MTASPTPRARTPRRTRRNNSPLPAGGVTQPEGKGAYEKKLIAAAGAVVCLLLALFLFAKFYVFSTQVDLTVPAYVFDGDSTSETTVSISGEIGKALLSDQKTYIGTFAVACYENLCKDGVQARIVWEEHNYQSILFYDRGDFVTFGTEQIIIDADMMEFAVRFEDGAIVATSEEMCQQINGGGQ